MPPSSTRVDAPLDLLTVAWSATVVGAGIPAILWLEVAGSPPDWLVPAQAVTVAVVAVLGLVVRRWSPIRRYLLVLAALMPIVHPAIRPSILRVEGFGGLEGAAGSIAGDLVVEAGLALLVVGVLALVGVTPRAAHLLPGRLGAPARRLWWVVDEGASWVWAGTWSALAIAAGTVAFLVVAAGDVPGPAEILDVLPVVVVLAAVNALNEEVVFRSAPLATLTSTVGTGHAMALNAALFGIVHYSGIPYGLPGVAMAAVFALWVSKAMLETDGIGWPWAIHFVQDVCIFTFVLAAGLGTGGI